MSRRMVCGVTEKWSASASIDMKPRFRTRPRICCWRALWTMVVDSTGKKGFVKEHLRSIYNAERPLVFLRCSLRDEPPLPEGRANACVIPTYAFGLRACYNGRF